MPLIRLMLSAILLAPPAMANGQTFSVHATAGPTVTDAGYSVAAGVGLSPSSRFTLGVNVERTHLVTQSTNDGPGGTSFFRGGTLTLGSAELQFVPLGRRRVGPYVLTGFAAGQSRPNVNATFPDAVTNDVFAGFVGGGVLVPVGERLSIFADARMMFGAEGVDGIFAVAPVRAGVSWTF